MNDDLQRELDALQRQLEAPPPAADSDAERRARELAVKARDKKIREWVEVVEKVLCARKT